MNYYIFIAIMAVIATAIALPVSIIKKTSNEDEISDEKKGNYIIRLPDWFFWLTYIYTWFFCSTFAYCIFIQKDTFTLIGWLLSMPVLLFGVVLYVTGKAWRIEIFKKKDYFIFRNIFFKKYVIYYSECINYRHTENSIVLKTEKRKIHVSNALNNVSALEMMLYNHQIEQLKY